MTNHKSACGERLSSPTSIASGDIVLDAISGVQKLGVIITTREKTEWRLIAGDTRKTTGLTFEQ